MIRTRVKICGITNSGDALLAVEAGADAIGMVFYEPSPRHVDIETASDIAKSIPAFVMSVGLFVNADKDRVKSVLSQVPLQLLQFHGDESPEYCEQFGMPYIKALRVGREEAGLNGDSLRTVVASHKNCCAILLDTYQKGVPGGTGESFDWDLIAEYSSETNPKTTGPKTTGTKTTGSNITAPKVILAGGLKPENIVEAINTVKPYAVDVSGGVESAPGAKDAVRIRAFLNSVHSTNCN